jgi:outer membrane lipoprotein-sorting protein
MAKPPTQREEHMSLIQQQATLKRCLTALCGLTVLATFSLAAEQDPWLILENAKQELRAAGPVSMDFVQTMTPAGFTGGDSEQGTLALDLPGCLRWDYQDPYPRSFLICGSVGYHWNQGESVGRRFFVTVDEPGLDLLLQDRAQLEARYDASLTRTADVTEIILVPRGKSDLVEARLVLDPETTQLNGLSYRDKEGNRNRFALSNRRPTGDSLAFEIPKGIAWSED